MSDKPPDDKNGLDELIKKLWLPFAGFVGAVTLSYNFYKMWQGDQETVTYVTAGAGLVVLVIVLGWMGFKTNTVIRDSLLRVGEKEAKKVPAYSPFHQWIARISLAIIILGMIGGIWSIIKQQQQYQQELKNKVVLVIAKFDGPEEEYGIRDQIIEQLREATRDFDDTIIIPLDEVVTPILGSEYARKLGEKNNADLIIWAWYKPTENPNITIHIENLSTTEITVIKESETYQPQATLAELETFEIQKKIGSETSTLITFLTGMLKFKSGDYQAAIERFEQVLGENDISTFVSRYDLFFNLGYSNNELGNYERAIHDYDKAIEIDPQYASAYCNRGGAYFALGQYERAIQDFDKAIETDSSFVAPYFGRGNAYDALGQYEKAIQDFDKAIEIDTNDYTPHYNNRGNAYSALGQYERAIDDYDKAIELDPNYALAYNNRGNAYNTLRQYEHAIEDYNKAIELDPNYAGAYLNRGNAYSDLRQYERAIEDYNKATERDPSYAGAYINRGNAYGNLGQYERAIEDYNKAIELDPTDAMAYINRGKAYGDLGQYERAIEDYNKAIELDPNDAMAYSNRGSDYNTLGQHEHAIEDCNKAIELDPNYAGAYINRGLAYQSLGKTTEAEADFKKYKELTGQKP